MSLYQTSLAELIKQVLLIGIGGDNWKAGTITGAPTTAQIIDSKRTETDDYFQNTIPISVVRIMSTTDGYAPNNEEAYFTDWTQSGAVGATAPVFTAAPAAGDTYAIFKEYSWEEVRAAINFAIDLVARVALIDTLDESQVLAATTYEYILPQPFTHIYRVSMEDANGDYPEPIPPEQYRIIKSGITPRLHFIRYPSTQTISGHSSNGLWADGGITADRHLRIEGFGRQAHLTGNSDQCKINPAFITYQAAALLHAKRIRRASNDPDEHQTQFTVCSNIANSISGGPPYYRALAPTIPPDCKKVEQ